MPNFTKQSGSQLLTIKKAEGSAVSRSAKLLFVVHFLTHSRRISDKEKCLFQMINGINCVWWRIVE